MSLATTIAFGCDDSRTLGPGDSQPPSAALRRAAWVLDVSRLDRAVRVTPPAHRGPFPAATLDLGERGESVPVAASMLAGDAAQLRVSHFVVQPSPVSGKLRLTFDVAIANKLSSVSLVTPTFPETPLGVTGVLLFPFSTNVIQDTGVVNGTDSLVIELPNTGQVTPSDDWDGEPFNFFNDRGCGSPSNDCYRYEQFAQPLVPLATTAARTVGFDIDPTVSSFRARLILAANLENVGPNSFATVTGSVILSRGGAASGIPVTLVPESFAPLPTVMTDAQGAFTIAKVPFGDGQIELGDVPNDCAAPSALPFVDLMPGSPSRTLPPIELSCGALGPRYRLTSTWLRSGDELVLAVAFDPTGRNDATINGASTDDIAHVSVMTMFDTTQLAFERAEGGDDAWPAPLVDTTSAGVIAWRNDLPIGVPEVTASAAVARFVFRARSGATSTGRLRSRIGEAVSAAGADLLRSQPMPSVDVYDPPALAVP